MDCQPSIPTWIWPYASSAQNSIAALSAEGRMVWVSRLRLISLCRRSMALVVRALFTGSGVAARRRTVVDGFLQAVGDGVGAEARHIREEGPPAFLDLRGRRRVNQGNGV